MSKLRERLRNFCQTYSLSVHASEIASSKCPDLPEPCARLTSYMHSAQARSSNFFHTSQNPEYLNTTLPYPLQVSSILFLL
jgi:hypothetical protein